MNTQTQPPDTPSLMKTNNQKTILWIALALTLASFLCFGLSSVLPKLKPNKERWQIVGGVFLMAGAILLFIAVLQSCFSRTPESLNLPQPTGTPMPQPTKKSKMKGTLIIISADSWCGFSKKMTAEVPSLKSLLAPMGVEVVLISDKQNKDAFKKISTEHSARGFPHSVLIVNGTKLIDIPGYMPAPKMQELVAAKL